MHIESDKDAAAGGKTLSPLLKFVLEMGPLLLFFFMNQQQGLYVATGVFIVVTVLALGVHYALVRSLPLMPLVSGFFIIVFGGLTLLLHDDLFIKMKPTIVNLIFAALLLGGLWRGRVLLRIVLGAALPLDEAGWRKLTFRWGLFFIALAVINEAVWRTQTTDFWVNFKVFGIMPLTVLFALSQAPLISRHMIEEASGEKD